tara:strand:- start:1584 stop:1733 length:150 start_codon:yes stop_codon:yes gene_type:complete
MAEIRIPAVSFKEFHHAWQRPPTRRDFVERDATLNWSTFVNVGAEQEGK